MIYQFFTYYNLKSWTIIIFIGLISYGCATERYRYSDKAYSNNSTYVIKTGDTLSSIAKLYNINYITLAKLNNIYPPYTIYKGNSIQIPINSQTQKNYQQANKYAKVSAVKSLPNNNFSTARSASNNFYTVAKGDTLYKIAKMNGSNYRQLAKNNNIPPPYEIAVGQRLQLTPTFSSPKPNQFAALKEMQYTPISTKAMPNSVSTKPVISHIVMPGDTIYSVTQRYGYKTEDIAKWNGLEPPYSLSVGRRLRVAPLNIKSTSVVSSYNTNTRATNTSASSYTVNKGDTLYAISKRFGSSTNRLAQRNNLSPPYTLVVGQRLNIATSAISNSQNQTRAVYTTTANHNSGYHRVRAGETLRTIATNYRYSISQLAAWNNLYPPYALSIGQELRVYPPTGIRLGLSRSNNSPHSINPRPTSSYHTVARGETLYAISKRYRKAVNQIMRWNNLRSSDISVGQRLKIAN
ncbi:MAG: LysM peptidoglycan-binding domain-containing protein [Thiomargarita sp.]|nr:LysM peptidoglycan-binding domain-containing protein [Thiomargarita sp.]